MRTLVIFASAGDVSDAIMRFNAKTIFIALRAVATNVANNSKCLNKSEEIGKKAVHHTGVDP